MKEVYTTPEVEMVCFVSCDKLASTIDFNGFFNDLSLSTTNPASQEEGDFKV